MLWADEPEVSSGWGDEPDPEVGFASQIQPVAGSEIAFGLSYSWNGDETSPTRSVNWEAGC